MKRFFGGQPVKFKSGTSDYVFHGRVVRRISDTDYLVEDRSGLAPRPVRTERLEPDVEGACFTPKVAA
jgi:hypothetical protein